MRKTEVEQRDCPFWAEVVGKCVTTLLATALAGLAIAAAVYYLPLPGAAGDIDKASFFGTSAALMVMIFWAFRGPSFAMFFARIGAAFDGLSKLQWHLVVCLVMLAGAAWGLSIGHSWLLGGCLGFTLHHGWCAYKEAMKAAKGLKDEG